MELSDYDKNTEQIAKILGYNSAYVRHLAVQGRLPAIKRGRAWLFSETEVLEHLKKETHKNGEAYGRRATDGDTLLR